MKLFPLPSPRTVFRGSLPLLASAWLALVSVAQERGREGGGPRMNPLFAALDANGDGVIDEAELQNATAALKKLDRNNDGKLTEEEVRPAFGRGGPGGPGGRGGGPGGAAVDEIVNRMLQFDKNGDGRLAKDELPERMQRMLERGDTNKDGFLSRDELIQLARAQVENGERGAGRAREEERR